jgi:non-ribosomal peptide synthetase-like protein
MYNGTPFKTLLWRALGVRIGHRVIDDGGWVVERTLTSIGDDCTLNEGSLVQAHSLEDGMFKSDRIDIGAGCTLGTHGLVHYGTQMGDGSLLEPDSFLMKGQRVGRGERWGGNPAHPLPAPS